MPIWEIRDEIPTVGNGLPNRCDVLSDVEESALAVLREIVTGLRVGDGALDIRSVETAMCSAGASNDAKGIRSESNTFLFRGARFSILVQLHPANGIEINFEPERQ